MIPGQRKLELNLLWDIQLAGQKVQETITSHRHITVFTYSVHSYSISLNKGKALHKCHFPRSGAPKAPQIDLINLPNLGCTASMQTSKESRPKHQLGHKKKGVKHKKTAAQGRKIAWAKSPSASSGKIHCTALPFTLSSFLPLRISPWQKNVPWRKKMPPIKTPSCRVCPLCPPSFGDSFGFFWALTLLGSWMRLGWICPMIGVTVETCFKKTVHCCERWDEVVPIDGNMWTIFESSSTMLIHHWKETKQPMLIEKYIQTKQSLFSG